MIPNKDFGIFAIKLSDGNYIGIYHSEVGWRLGHSGELIDSSLVLQIITEL